MEGEDKQALLQVGMAMEETGSRLVDKNALKGLLHHLLAVPGAQLKECVLCTLCV